MLALNRGLDLLLLANSDAGCDYLFCLGVVVASLRS